MELEYICTGTEDMKPIRWKGHINLLISSDHYEMRSQQGIAAFISFVGNMSMEVISAFLIGT